MSVVAWDGKTLAADRQSTNHGHKAICRKLWVVGDSAIAVTGSIAEGLAMKAWFEAGADPAEYPGFQGDKERWCRLIVVTADALLEYEQPCTPVPWPRDKPMAWGSGRDFALGAMTAGADAIVAVEITNSLSTETGFGVDAWSF